MKLNSEFQAESQVIRQRKWIFSRKWDRKKIEWERKGKEKQKEEKIKFSQENAAENIFQGGYQISFDTILWNMASMEGMREIDQSSLYWWKLNITNEWKFPLMGWLQATYSTIC